MRLFTKSCVPLNLMGKTQCLQQKYPFPLVLILIQNQVEELNQEVKTFPCSLINQLLFQEYQNYYLPLSKNSLFKISIFQEHFGVQVWVFRRPKWVRTHMPDVRYQTSVFMRLCQMSSWPTIHHPIEIYCQTNRCLIEPTYYLDQISTFKDNWTECLQ